MSDPTGSPPGWQSPPPPTLNVNVQAPVIVVTTPKGPGFGIRAVWFIFIGWWLTFFVVVLAYLAALVVVGLPLAFYLFNRIPTVLTLRGRSTTYQATTSADGRTTYLNAVNIAQRPMWMRAVWFICIGWWFGAIWMSVAYVLCILILTLPIGLMMFDRTGGVMTLLRY